MENLGFSKSVAVLWGEYLLSDERKDRIVNHPEAASMAPVEDRLKQVHDADIENFLEKIKSELTGTQN